MQNSLFLKDQVFRAIHEHGSKSYVHTCGAIGDRLDLMSETCVDGIDTLDPPPLGTVDLAEAKSKYGRRFFFKGNLDSVNEMLNADDQTFEQAVLLVIGYVLHEFSLTGSGQFGTSIID